MSWELRWNEFLKNPLQSRSTKPSCNYIHTRPEHEKPLTGYKLTARRISELGKRYLQGPHLTGIIILGRYVGPKICCRDYSGSIPTETSTCAADRRA